MFSYLKYFVNNYWKPLVVTGIDSIINNHILIKNNFTFIQVGSNDGRSNDPLYKFINLYKCRGVLIEPVKYIFEKLKENYNNIDDIYFENIAISDTNSIQKFYEIKQNNDPNLPHWYNQLSSFNLKTILSYRSKIPNIESLIQETDIETKSINNILNKYQNPDLNILHIDTEGYDYEIIKSINFDLICPSILIYEHKHLSIIDYRSSLKHLK